MAQQASENQHRSWRWTRENPCREASDAGQNVEVLADCSTGEVDEINQESGWYTSVGVSGGYHTRLIKAEGKGKE